MTHEDEIDREEIEANRRDVQAEAEAEAEAPRAEPVAGSITTLLDVIAVRLGYRKAAICQHCHVSIIMEISRSYWVHRRNYTEYCSRSWATLMDPWGGGL